MEPIKKLIEELNNEIKTITDKKNKLINNEKKNSGNIINSLENKFSTVYSMYNKCKIEEDYKNMFTKLDIPEIKFVVKKMETLEQNNNESLGTNCRHKLDKSYHSINGSKHRYYIIIDEDSNDVFVYCEKCGISQPKIMMNNFMPKINNKLITLSIKPNDDRNNYDKRSNCYKNLNTDNIPLSSVISYYCSTIGDPVGELSNGNCSTTPIVLAVKFNYNNLIEVRDVSTIKGNNYKPIMEELNYELKNITELKVKSIRKLNPTEIANYKI